MTVHLRKMYVDCRYGQLHMHTAFPSNGGFDERTALVCIHPGPLSGRVFRALLADLGEERSVYAPDLPGCGESDAPHQAPGIAEYAAAIGDLLDTLRLRCVDVLGYQSGSLVAAELAIARSEQVRRAVLVGVPVLDAREREASQAQPSGEDPAGAQRAGETAAWLPAAAAAYAAAERLPRLRQPTLVLRAKDELWDMTARADALLRDARRVDLETHGRGLHDTGAADVARHVREFLDR